MVVSARLPIIVTRADLRTFAQHLEGTTLTASHGLYIARLGELEQCDVIVVDEKGQECQFFDFAQHLSILRSIAAVDRRVMRLHLRRRRRRPNNGE
jgi:thymidine kinase